ncbi:hypothetical protein CVT24_002567 [Panaeolus cyanescens]|uniref:Arabinan endo-1,5-alpha-L-arabinosidase n=1 Tax=Panaeolus cyanescens TaxID=181874 RepID=A0A409YTY5_9AGAR|nr:hypothetical protein CVT24_002567 [Panaeolus cyanescens]
MCVNGCGVDWILSFPVIHSSYISVTNGTKTGYKASTLMSGGGSLVLQGHGDVHGPGGQDIIMDNGTPVLVYHYYNAAGTNVLGINKLDFSSGWPVVV